MSKSFEALSARLPALDIHPRTPLVTGVSPLDLSVSCGDSLGIDLDVKRDDALPLAMGGNKVRQLEYYFGQAEANDADTVLITGAVQSNFVRLCAAAARQKGWHPIVQLENRVPKEDKDYQGSGNVLLMKMLEAEIHTFAEGENEAAADANLDRLADEARAKGRRPYSIHLGIDHPPWGGIGYAAAAVETYLQYEALGFFPDAIVVPSGSGLTHAGFLVGVRAIGWKVPVYGICVRREAVAQSARILRRSRELADLLKVAAPMESDVLVADAVLAPGYGRMNPAVSEAISLAATSDALLLDPVYSGRCFAGLIDHVRSGQIGQGARVCFIHTGGTPALFAYRNDLGL